MEENNQNKNKRELSFDITPDVACGTYSNMAMIAHSHSEFVTDFVQMMPGAKPRVVSRIILSPEHAKRLLAALKDNIAKYEKDYGEIKVPHAQPTPMMPPMNFGGEA